MARVHDTSTTNPELEPSPAGASLSVLLVDDQAHNLLAFESLLERSPWRVEQASSGREALRRLSSDSCGLVVLDVRMPDMDGFEVARHMREASRTKHIPILFVSGAEREADFELRALELGGIDYLRKPVCPDLLRAKVDALMSLSSDRWELARRTDELTCRQRELEHANRELESFGFAVAHDLNSPVRQIEHFLKLLRERFPERIEDDAASYLERAIAAAGRLGHMIDGLLEYARLGASPSEPGAIPGAEITAEAQANLLLAFETSQARLEVDELPRIVGPRLPLVRLFQNLFENALKHGGRDGLVIRVGARVHDGRATISVADDGRGIPREERAHLFELFRRPPRSAELRGSGIGLASCRKIVRMLGGEIWLQDVASGGACFCFELPIAAGPAAVRGPLRGSALGDLVERGQRGRDEWPGDSRLRVLLIDDSPDERAMVRDGLERAGISYEAREAPDGHVGLELFEQERFDCVVVDLQLPGIDGREVMRRLRALDATCRIIATSASNDPSWHGELLALGADAVFPKARWLESSALRRLLYADVEPRACASQPPGPTARPRGHC